MSERDTVGEILELAIDREVDAYNFYMEMAKRSANVMLQKIFEGLARVELEHKAKLELEFMKEGKVLVDKKRAEDFDLSDYLVDNRFLDDWDYKDVLFVGIEKEKRSVRFYIELAAIMAEKRSREVLLSLAEEEASHKAELQMEYDRLALKGE
jgi:rubrerythrin